MTGSPGHYESTDESAEAPGTVEEQTSAACAAAVKGDCHSLMTCNVRIAFYDVLVQS